MISIKPKIIKIVKELDKNNIDYFITGGNVLFLKGIIKETKDIDFFVNYKDLKRLKEIYTDYVIPSEKGKHYLNLNISGI
jgi:phosphorylcholine metabolism protein LicD